jgi:hypothetical protein
VLIPFGVHDADEGHRMPSSLGTNCNLSAWNEYLALELEGLS